MKLFKVVDCWIQGALIFLSIPFIILGNNFMVAYFVVGGLQLTSTFIHFLNKGNFIPDHHRRYYNRTVFGVILITLLGCLTDGVLIFLLILLVVSAIMAVWYLVICFAELNKLKEVKSPDLNTTNHETL